MKTRKKVLYISIIILLIATIFIGVGLYLNSISKPKYIFTKAIDIYKNKINNYNKSSEDLNLKDKYSIEGKISFDLDSEIYKKGQTEDDIKKYNIINNLNKSNTTFKIQKDQSKNTGYIELLEKIEDEEIINAKYYIADSTKYYFINDIVNTYINDGSCNYFESLNKDNTEKENIDYLYNFIIKSIKNNLREEYFTTKEDKNENIASIKLNNSNIKSILNNLLNDLKKDKKSRNILDNIDKRILKTKIKEDKTYLEKDEYYKISIYTTKILHKPIKYKLEHITKDDRKTFIYEGNENKGTLYYLDNEITTYIIDVELKNNEIKATIKDSSNEKIGEFKVEKDNYNLTINYVFDDDQTKIDLIYSSKYTKVKKNTSYNNEKKLSFKYIVNKETKINGDIVINLKTKNKFTILTNVEDARLKSTLTEEEKNKLDNLYENIKSSLER